MIATEVEEAALARAIADLPDQSIAEYIKEQSARKQLSATVRVLNRGALSRDTTRRNNALAAIRKLGFI